MSEDFFTERLKARTVEVRIGKYEYKRLTEKAEEMGEDLITVLEWLVEDYLDEI